MRMFKTLQITNTFKIRWLWYFECFLHLNAGLILEIFTFQKILKYSRSVSQTLTVSSWEPVFALLLSPVFSYLTVDKTSPTKHRTPFFPPAGLCSQHVRCILESLLGCSFMPTAHTRQSLNEFHQKGYKQQMLERV